jgi:ATP-dependent exoDNAse (exonuclease V) beta subunit
MQAHTLQLQAYELLIESMTQGAAQGDKALLDAYLELRSSFSEHAIKQKLIEISDALRKHGCNPADANWSQWSNPLLVDDISMHAHKSPSQIFLELCHAYSVKYADLREDAAVLDFNDVLLLTNKLLDNKQVLKSLQKQFTYTMVDEAQDTNPLQMEIVEKIAGDNLFQVGDTKQSIYRFQGAEPSGLEEHARALSMQENAQEGAQESEQGSVHTCAQGEIFELTVNYRSSKELLDFVNGLFGNDELLGKSAVALRAGSEKEPEYKLAGESVQLLEIDLPKKHKSDNNEICYQAEAVWIADRFEEIRRAGRVDGRPGERPWNHFKVLTRSRTQGEYVLAEFIKRGMPALIIGGESLLEKPLVKEARLFLKMLDDPRGSETFLKLLLSPMGRVSDRGIYELAHLMRSCDELKHLWDAAQIMVDSNAEDCLSDPKDQESLHWLVECVLAGRESLGRTPLSSLLEKALLGRELDLYYLSTGGLSEDQASLSALAGRQIYAGFQQFLRMADNWQESGRDLLAFADDLDNQEATRQNIQVEAVSKPDEECIVINTIHSSKGDEYPIVALPFARCGSMRAHREALMLHISQQKEDAQSDELVLVSNAGPDGSKVSSPRFDELHADFKSAEHSELMRLLYVACTRAETQLLISYRNISGDGLSDAMARGVRAAAETFDELEQRGDLKISHMCEDEARELVRGSSLKSSSCCDEDGEVGSKNCQTQHDKVAPLQELPEGPPRLEEPPAPPPVRLNQVSASDIQAFHKCPRHFYLMRVLRLGELQDKNPAKASNRGSLIHLLLEWGSLDQADVLFARNQVPAELGEELKSVVQNFQNSELWKRLEGSVRLHKEHAFYLPLSKAGHTPHFLKGFIDIMGWQDEDTLLIVDYKTGASEVSSADYLVQARAYAFAGLALGAPKVEVIMVRPEVIEKNGQPEQFSFCFTSDQQEEMRASLLESVHEMEHAAEADLSTVDREFCDAFCTLRGVLCEGPDET